MDRVNRTLVLILGGAAYSFAFPPFGWWPLALLGVGILTGLLRGTTTCQGGWWQGFIWGMAAFGTGLSWMWHIFGALSIVLWGVLALFPALFGWLVAQVRRHGLEGGRLALFVAVAWTGTEFLRCEVMPLRFPWLHLGMALEPWPLVSWVGVYGLGFVAALVVAALVYWRLVLAMLVMAAGVFGWLMEVELFYAAAIPVTAVQAETAPLDTYLELSKQAPASTRLIVWPEYAVAKDIRRSEGEELDAVRALAGRARGLVVFGTQTRLEGAKWQNTALTVNADGVVGEHGKNHTVHFFDDGEHGATAKAFVIQMGDGSSGPPFIGKMGTPICFDCDFQDVVRRMVVDGAEFLAVPSMDAVSWSARQHIQHAQLFRVRAAENRRWMVVAASSGVSQIINAEGRATASLGAMKQGVLNGKIAPIREITFFTRVGWLTPWIVLGVLLIWTIWLLAFSEKRKQQPDAGSID